MSLSLFVKFVFPSYKIQPSVKTTHDPRARQSFFFRPLIFTKFPWVYVILLRVLWADTFGFPTCRQTRTTLTKFMRVICFEDMALNLTNIPATAS